MRYFIVLLTAILFLQMPPVLTEAAETDPTCWDFTLPASLEVLEDEAFENTAVTKVYIQDNLMTLGQRAFADSPDLVQIFIPDTTKRIGDDAFEGDVGLIIFGNRGSQAERHAKDHHIPFKTYATVLYRSDKRNTFRQRVIQMGRAEQTCLMETRSTGRGSGSKEKPSYHKENAALMVQEEVFP